MCYFVSTVEINFNKLNALLVINLVGITVAVVYRIQRMVKEKIEF